ncbi:MAG: type IV secretory system conjugative DNA transfer family protein [Phyllobacteriaceae bacterium]|jgi:type IV secretion system protein VirD4|nr:type IV secretory system conjugative DNA transfer family protein [Phyllobacteriaceae bacterium]
MAGNNQKQGSPTGMLLLGVSMLALSAGWPSLTGTAPDAGGQLYLGLLGGFGFLTTAGGVAGLYGSYRRREQRKAAAQTSGVFGTADFASLEECDAAGMDNPNGLYLGLLDGEPLFYNGKAHLLTCAPARQGKGINAVIPNLLHYPGAVVVTDPKGELAAVTAKHRAERFGHKVVVLNPWGLHGLPQDRINPLQEVIRLAGDPVLQRGLAGEVKVVALQLLPEPEDARNRFFRDGSRAILRGVLMYLALHKPQLCTLPEMWRHVANPRRLAMTVDAMQRSDLLGGLLADLGDDLAVQMADNADQFADFRAGAVQALDIYQPGDFLADAVGGSDIDLADVKGGDVSIYLAFPQDRIASHGAALGLIVNQTITSVARSPKQGKALFMLDEFANLGKLSGLAESLTALPGLGVRVWMHVQEFAELVRIYGPHTAKTIQSQAEVKQFFAVNTFESAKLLSDTLGQRTAKTRSHNLGRTDDDDIGESLSETGQPLMRPEDILLMQPHEQLLLVKGLRPVRAVRVPFWFVSPWGGWAEANPVEGAYPQVKPLFALSYGLNAGTE